MSGFVNVGNGGVALFEGGILCAAYMVGVGVLEGIGREMVGRRIDGRGFRVYATNIDRWG